jgi:hypothetical protein
MLRTPTLLLTCLFGLTLQAQTFFYIGDIVVVPADPSTSDNVRIDLVGDLSDTGASIVSSDAVVQPGLVSITLVANSTGGATVIVPHTHSIELGQLPAGTYTIAFTLNSFGILDLAPGPQHTFTVSGSGDPCADLDLLAVQWQAFGDTAIMVNVQNNSTTLFDYPNFILFDAAGDTLAVEAVNLFGIAGNSWHVLRIVNGAIVPNTPFSGRLELWTDFTTDLACSWESTFELCPPPACAELRPTVANISGMLVTGAFNWVVYDETDLIANGQFTLGANAQTADTALCLPPGEYHVNVSPADPAFMGILYYYVTAPGGQTTPSMPVTSSLPVLLPFTFYGPCISGSQSVPPVDPAPVGYAPSADGLLVWNTTGAALGDVMLFDAQGRLLFSTTSSTDRLLVPVDKPGLYILRSAAGTVKFAHVY